MKLYTITRRLFFLGLFLFFRVGLANAQYAVGDYGATSSGAWSNAAIWSTWNGAAWTGPGASGIPTSLTNAFILTGRTVNVTAGPAPCMNLTVEAGAKLWTANNPVNVYVYVNGTKLVCDGQIGDGATFDGISFGIEGAVCTISGAGQFDASRLRKNLSTIAITNLTITRNINLRFNTATTTQLYNAANNTLFNLTISSGATVNLIPSGPNTGNVCIDGLDGTGVALNAGGTYTIDGTLIISGKLYATTNNTNAAYSCSWIINGLVKANEVVASSSGTAGHSFIINSGGKLDITGTAAWSSLGTTNNSFSFNNLSTVEYSASGAQLVRVKAEFAAGAPTVFQEYGYLILSGSGLKSTNQTGLYIKNDLTITGSAVLDPVPTTCFIFLGGDWINYNQSGFSEKTTTVWFNGATLQTINCPGGEIYNTIRYSKSGGNLQFNTNVDVLTQLVYSTNGYVDLNSNTLTIINPFTNGIQGMSNQRYIVSEKTDNSSRIVWKINFNTGSYTIPFGVIPGGASNYIPVIITKLVADNIGDVMLATYGTGPDNLPWPSTPTNVTNLQSDIAMHNVPDNRHWTVDRFWEVGSTAPTTINSLIFSYRAVELPDSDATPANLGAQYWNIPISYWNRTQFGTPAAYNVNVSGFNNYNTSWTLTSLISPLPIELMSFTATPENETIRLDWITASEINNDYFLVEKSFDGRKFFRVGEIEGAHNSTTKKEYILYDVNPTVGISYYRLKQTDYDGAYSYSDIVAVNYKNKTGRSSVFPNPAGDHSFLVTGSREPLEVAIRNVEGKLINSFAINGSENPYPLDLSSLTPGLYFIELKSVYESQFLRLMKQ